MKHTPSAVAAAIGIAVLILFNTIYLPLFFGSGVKQPPNGAQSSPILVVTNVEPTHPPEPTNQP